MKYDFGLQMETHYRGLLETEHYMLEIYQYAYAATYFLNFVCLCLESFMFRKCSFLLSKDYRWTDIHFHKDEIVANPDDGYIHVLTSRS